MAPTSACLNVSIVQMQGAESLSANFANAVAFLIEAVTSHKAHLIVFPENFLTLGLSDLKNKEDELTHCIERFRNFAKEYQVYILLGSIPIKALSGKFYSRSFLVSPTGDILGHYDKIHLFDVFVADNQGAYKESDTYLAGTTPTVLPVFDYKLGLSICYDLRFPELYQRLRYQKAELIAVPSAFTFKTGQNHWEILVRARAIETQCFVFAANHCGDHLNTATHTIRSTWGHSMIVDPWGRVLNTLADKPGICSASCDMGRLQEIRGSMDLFSHKRL